LYSKQYTTRKEADQIFYEAMKDDKVATGVRHLIHLFVRMFGWYAWKQNKSKLPK